MAENEYQGIGRIDRIEERETQSGKKYILTVVEGQRYSCWRPDAIQGLEPGDFVNYRWRVNDGYKNLLSMKKVDSPQEYKSFAKYRVLTEDQLASMVRMSALKSSVAVVGRSMEGTIEERKDLALKLAQDFESYILNRTVGEAPKPEQPKKKARKKKAEAAQVSSKPVMPSGDEKDLPF